MRKVTTFVAIAALVSQVAAPAFAGDMFNRTTILGATRTSGAAAMGYFRLPLGQAAGKTSAPRFGLMVAGPQTYSAGDVPLALNAPRILDFAVTGRDLSTPFASSSWRGSLTVGNTVAWVSDAKGLPASEAPHLLESGTSWIVVGALTAGAVAGAFALTNRKR
ncbi:MAG: hypothetical protein K1X51_03645 [Rhodospirillaceae bacterium]|nr:hypothetical protein [Rhodospirillaceae bacterium]